MNKDCYTMFKLPINVDMIYNCFYPEKKLDLNIQIRWINYIDI